ncbi:MAG: hypothetical protein WAO71_10570 [Gallionella sp.]
MTVHLVMPDGGAGNDFLQLVAQKRYDEFGIEHATIQIEASRQSCTLHP